MRQQQFRWPMRMPRLVRETLVVMPAQFVIFWPSVPALRHEFSENHHILGDF